jgi:hypothetical protein
MKNLKGYTYALVEAIFNVDVRADFGWKVYRINCSYLGNHSLKGAGHTVDCPHNLHAPGLQGPPRGLHGTV